METTLVINPGSSSRKYALYCDDSPILELRFEDTNAGYEICSRMKGLQPVCESITKAEFDNSIERVAEEVDRQIFRDKSTKVGAVVVRVVAPGTKFQKHTQITERYIRDLKAVESVAPLHIPTILKELEAIKKYFRGVKIFAASDSAFHANLPPKVRDYTIDKKDAAEHDIYRFGYHGLSVSSVIRKIHPIIGIEPENMVVCHIGNGTSVTAVKNGQSAETSMGFSPTSGLPMGSRAGDLDATALLDLMRARHWRPRDAELYLNTRGGLFGLSGESDIRRLLDLRSQNNQVAIDTLDKFVYCLQKAVAASTVSLGGLDVLVLTATASVRSSELRYLILDGLRHLGVEVSKDRNDVLVGKDGVVSVRNSRVKAVVMKTDEMGEMNIVANQLRNNT